LSRLSPTIVALVMLGGALATPMLAPADPDRNTAPSFTVHTFDGRTLKFSELHGKPVILDFWATWCRPCRAGMPHLSSIQERYRDKGLVVIGLSVDDGEAAGVKHFAEQLGVKFRVGMADEQVLDDFGPIRSIPTTVFIDRKGAVVRRVVGYIDEETMDGYAKEIL